jgi:hypothetical protein
MLFDCEQTFEIRYATQEFLETMFPLREGSEGALVEREATGHTPYGKSINGFLNMKTVSLVDIETFLPV